MNFGREWEGGGAIAQGQRLSLRQKQMLKKVWKDGVPRDLRRRLFVELVLFRLFGRATVLSLRRGTF